MMLSDRTYRALIESGDVKVVPAPADYQYQPVSLDLLLGTSFAHLARNQFGTEHRFTETHLQIQPGEFLLAATEERIQLPAHVAGVVHGKSTWARRGLMVEAAGLVDPGFDGTITLEIKNLSDLPIRLFAGRAIAQISFHLIDLAVARPYGSAGLRSHYQGQTLAETARG
jgi:dCTP deaminase